MIYDEKTLFHVNCHGQGWSRKRRGQSESYGLEHTERQWCI